MLKKIISLLLLQLFAWPALAETGFLVAAPDRGFVGNTETREAFADFAAQYPAELVFVTDERALPYFQDSITALEKRGIDEVVLLPFYLSTAHPDFDLLREWAVQAALPVQFGRAFGNSSLAVRALADRLATVPADAGTVVVTGEGAETDTQAAAMQNDYQRLFTAAAERFGFADRKVVILHDNEDDLAGVLKNLPANSVLVPFHLGAKYDGMMSLTAWLRYAAPKGMTVLQDEVTPHPAVADWLQREAARYQDYEPEEIGVVVHAHGADFHWNERMREAAAPLAGDYLVEYAFSMGDPDTLQHAVDKLRQRGARLVVIVRVFGRSGSFLSGIERFIGTDYENCRAGGSGHGGHHGMTVPPRLLTPLPVVTIGGLEDNPLFARALLSRARGLAQNPAQETVILVSHGVGSDSGNDEWLAILDSLRQQMLANGGDKFRAIEIGTWREDWPDKRTAAVEHIRDLIKKAQQNNGRAIVIPARTNAQGPARELIPDMDYALGEGFAPHPLFVEWLRAQVKEGVAAIHYAQAPAACINAAQQEHAHH